MTALSAGRNRPPRTMRKLEIALTSGEVAYKSGAAFLVDGKAVVATATEGAFFAGIFAGDYDASDGDVRCAIDLLGEIVIWPFANATGDDACSATTVGKLVYFTDDNTVSPVSTGRSLAGRCWRFDSSTGRVWIEKLNGLVTVTVEVAAEGGE